MVDLYTPVLCRPSCNLFVKDPLENSEILHSSEGGDVERWFEPQNNSLVFAIACILLSIAFYILYLGSSFCLISLLALHSSLLRSVFTHLNKEAIEHINLLSREIKEEKFYSPSREIQLQFLF